jgi:hypothetical protein
VDGERKSPIGDEPQRVEYRWPGREADRPVVVMKSL